MISVAYFGTCRIHNPLTKLASLKLIKLNNSTCQAYVHSTEEILQQIRFIQGNKLPPKILWNWVIGEKYQGLPLVNNFNNTDVFIVEISSTKVCKFRNYFLKPFQIASIVRNDQKSSVNNNYANTRTTKNGIESKIIKNYYSERQNLNDVKKGMDAIASNLPGKVIFVTHINSLTEQGKTLPSRENLINAIEAHGKSINTPVFNPTNLVEKYGQSFALKNNGQDLNHYSSFFFQVLSCHIFENYLA